MISKVIERREMVARALATCPDIGDDDAVIRHLHALGMTITQIDCELAEMIDEARACQAVAFFGDIPWSH